MRLGYKNVYRMPTGYFGWVKDVLKHDRSTNYKQKPGQYFPECQFVSINRQLDFEYLGIDKSTKKIRLIDINSQFIYVALFNEMCLQCVEEMKQYRKFFKSFQQDEQFRNKIKIIGIGAGSTNRSAKKFVKLNNIPFPIFADKNWDIFKCLGEPLLPISYLLKKDNHSRIEIKRTQHEHIHNISDTLAELRTQIY